MFGIFYDALSVRRGGSVARGFHDGSEAAPAAQRATNDAGDDRSLHGLFLRRSVSRAETPW